MTEDGGLYIKTRFLSHRDKTGKLWKLRELHETEWEVTEIWVRCVEGDLGFHVLQTLQKCALLQTFQKCALLQTFQKCALLQKSPLLYPAPSLASPNLL